MGKSAITLLLSLLANVAQPAENERLTVHRAPDALSEKAVVESWPRFLGPHDDMTSRETPIDWSGLEEGPVWELITGAGYANVAVQAGVVYLYHRMEDDEVLEARHALDGSLIWQQRDPVEYRDRFGYNDGPRSGPVLAGDQIYTYGVTGRLTCREKEDGRQRWQIDLAEIYGTSPGFFGVGASPVIYEQLLIVNVGGDQDECVIAFDRLTGEEIWIARHEWGASYASPVIADLHGEPRLLVFAGGESDPATGGLLCLDPATGKVLGEVPWRADKYQSVNAVTPVVVDEQRVFITETYGPGGAMVEFDEQWQPAIVWTTKELAVHMMNPVVIDGYLYGFDGRHQVQSELVCLRVSDGKPMWRDPMRWQVQVQGREMELGLFRGSLLVTDNGVLALGETGLYAVLKLSPQGVDYRQRGVLFLATQSWTPPALSEGLLFISQNERDQVSGARSRLWVFDVRGN